MSHYIAVKGSTEPVPFQNVEIEMDGRVYYWTFPPPDRTPDRGQSRLLTGLVMALLSMHEESVDIVLRAFNIVLIDGRGNRVFPRPERDGEEWDEDELDDLEGEGLDGSIDA